MPSVTLEVIMTRKAFGRLTSQRPVLGFDALARWPMVFASSMELDFLLLS